eukprot:scaffold2319_cov350-Pavlova_lutheri.AAC.5
MQHLDARLFWHSTIHDAPCPFPWPPETVSGSAFYPDPSATGAVFPSREFLLSAGDGGPGLDIDLGSIPRSQQARRNCTCRAFLRIRSTIAVLHDMSKTWMKHTSLLRLLVAIATVAWAAMAQFDHEGVVTINSGKEFATTIKGEKPTFVKFYAPWCGHWYVRPGSEKDTHTRRRG